MKKRGFIALMSVIILSAVLLGMAATASTAGFFARFSALDKEYKKSALGLADSCANVALLTLAQNYAYTPTLPVVVSLDSDTCTIQSITNLGAPSASSRTVLITATASYREAFSAVEVNATAANPASSASPVAYPIIINSWREIN
ncbi:MAG: hypothetical protein ABSE76_00340 [Minisyncoccia bacterium]|jgi:hypothetical protein